MATSNQVLTKLRRICASLPDAVETMTWGKPHFRVADKIFVGFGEENGRSVIGFKLPKKQAVEIVKDPRFWPAPYVGKHGWVSMDASAVKDWEEVKGFVLVSYRLIAPKKLLARMDAGDQSDRKPMPTKMKRATRGTAKKK